MNRSLSRATWGIPPPFVLLLVSDFSCIISPTFDCNLLQMMPIRYCDLCAKCTSDNLTSHYFSVVLFFSLGAREEVESVLNCVCFYFHCRLVMTRLSMMERRFTGQHSWTVCNVCYSSLMTLHWLTERNW